VIGKTFKKLASVVALGVAFGVPVAADAQQVYSFQDDDIDFVLRNGVPVTSGPILTGDIFVSVFEIPTFTIDGVPSIPDGQELTGVAAVQLVSDPATGFLTFAPIAGGLNTILPGPDVPGGDAGAVIAMWLNSDTGGGADINLDVDWASTLGSNCTSLADCVTQASLGTLFQVDGFIPGGATDFWNATVNLGALLPPDQGGVGCDPRILECIANAPAEGPVLVNVSFGLSNFQNLLGPVQGQLTGSATLTGGAGAFTNGAVANSDFDARKVVPEPGALALLAAGLLGLGFRRFRRT
jgi:hypothetical protein